MEGERHTHRDRERQTEKERERERTHEHMRMNVGSKVEGSGKSRGKNMIIICLSLKTVLNNKKEKEAVGRATGEFFGESAPLELSILLYAILHTLLEVIPTHSLAH